MQVLSSRKFGDGPTQVGDELTLIDGCGTTRIVALVGNPVLTCGSCRDQVQVRGATYTYQGTRMGITFTHGPRNGGTPMPQLPTYAAIAKSFGDSMRTFPEKSFRFESAPHDNALAIAFRSVSNGDSNMFLVMALDEWWIYDDYSEARVRSTYPKAALIDVSIEASDMEDLRTGKTNADDLFAAGKARISGDAQVISTLGTVFEKLFV